MSQQQDRRFGFFRLRTPSHREPIEAACSFVAWTHHTSEGPLMGFGFCDQFRTVEDPGDTHCYEWEIKDGRATSKHIPPTELL